MIPHITPIQSRKLHALINRIGIDDGTYRAMLWERYQVETSKSLTAAQAESLIAELETGAVKLGCWQPRSAYGRTKYRELADRPGMASPKQIRMIEAAWRDVSWAKTDEKRASSLRKFMRKIVGVDALQFLDSVQARKIYNAIERMRLNQLTKGAA